MKYDLQHKFLVYNTFKTTMKNKKPHARRRVKNPSAYSLIVICISFFDLTANM